MKKTFALVALSVAAVVLSSCGGGIHPTGALYTEVSDPVAVSGSAGSRVGKATATSYLNLVATGDASVAAAKANGGISTVSSVDIERKSILGIINTYTTVVRGN